MSAPAKHRPGGSFVPEAGLTCTVEHRARDVAVYLHGELDLATAPELRRRLLGLFTLPVDTVTLDLADLTFIDAQGLRVLIAAGEAASERQVKFVLQGVTGLTRRLLELTGMTGVLDVRDGA